MNAEQVEKVTEHGKLLLSLVAHLSVHTYTQALQISKQSLSFMKIKQTNQNKMKNKN